MYHAFLLGAALSVGQTAPATQPAEILPALTIPQSGIVQVQACSGPNCPPNGCKKPSESNKECCDDLPRGNPLFQWCHRSFPCLFGCDHGCKNGHCPPKECCEEKKEEKKDEGCADEGPWRLCNHCVGGFKMTGWVYGTYVYNATNSGDTRYNGPMTMNDQVGGYLNQLWLNVARALPDEELGWGATLDTFFGNDYLASLSRGFENRRARGWIPHWWDNQDYGIAIPQAYVEVGSKKYNLRAGHFYTPHGYMVVQATGNFFNTLPYGFMMTNPFTHWGVMGNAALSDSWSVMGAIVNGWDALDRPVNAASYMGQLKYSFADSKGYFSTTLITGQEPENLGPGYAARTLVTNVFDYKFTERFEWVFENNLLWQRNRGGLGTDFSWSAIPYFFYKINDALKAGLRYEYFYDPTGVIAAERVGNPNNGPFITGAGPYHGHMQSLTAGLNWAPNASKNLMIRPEVRYDWFVGGQNPFNAGNSDHQMVVMIGAYYQF